MMYCDQMKKGRKNLIFIITYIAYSSVYISRINLSMAGPGLKEIGALTTAQLGFLGTAFSVVYAVGRLFNSMWADTAEPRTMIGIGLLGTGLASLGVGLLPPFAAILLLWCANAFAQSMLWASVLRIISSMYTDSRERTSRLSLIVSTVATGQVAGILCSLLILNNIGLQWAFLIPGFWTVALAGLVVFTYPLVERKKTAAGESSESENRKETAKNTDGAEQAAEAGKTPAAEASRNPFARMLEVCRIAEVRLAMIPCVFMGLLKDNVTLWMAVYYVDTYGIRLEDMSWYVLFIPLVGLAARLLFALFLKLARYNEHIVSMFSFAGSLAASVLLVTVHDPVVAVIALSLVYACMSLTNSSMLSIFPARYLSKGCMAAISGVLDFVAYLGAGIGSTVFGLTIDRYGYGMMFASWAVMSVIGGVIMYLLVRKLKKEQQ